MKRLSYILFAAYCILCISPNLFGQTVSNEVVDTYIEPCSADLGEKFPTTITIVAEKLDSQGEQELVVLRDGIDLSRRNLRNVSIHNRKLKNVDFSYSDLTLADVRNSIFENCNFSHAVLTSWEKGTFTKFYNCKFDDVVMKDCFDVCLVPVIIPFKNWKEVASRLYGDPKNDSLDSAGNDIDDWGLLKRGFQRTTQEEFINTVYYKDKVFCKPSFYKERWPENIPQEGPKVSFIGMDFSNAVFFGGLLDYDFEGANFENATFIYTAVGGNFTNANFKNATFIGTRIVGEWRNANIENAKFIRPGLGFGGKSSISFEQLMSTWNWKNNHMDEIPQDYLKLIIEEKQQTEKTEERFEFNFPKK